MLLAIKDKTKGFLGFFVIALITIPFTLWGIQSYLGDDSPLYIAKVNDVEITTQEFNRVLSNQRQSLQQKYKGKLPFDEMVLKKQVLGQLINQSLLEDVSFKNGYRISDNILFDKIKNDKNFSKGGVFDKERYKDILAANGITSPQYEQMLRADMQAAQIQNGILLSGFATNKETKRYANLVDQTREFSYMVFDKENTPSDISVSEEDISKYYKANSSQFMSSEKVKLEYIEVKSEDLSSDDTVKEEQVVEMYDAYRAGIEQNEERKARHILLTVKEDDDKSAAIELLKDLKEQIAEGASFEKLAKAHSKDPGSAQQGGDLDWVTREQMVKSFENVLFELKEGEVSDIVETQFGLHLIKLDEIRHDKILTLAEKRDEIVSELKSESVESKFYDIADNLAAVAYENVDNLDIPAEILNLDVRSSQLFTRQAGDGIAQHDKVREVAFSESVLDKGENSDVIEISPKHIVVVRIAERIPAKVKPFETVAAMIKEILEVSNSREVVLAAANVAKENIDNGKSIESHETGKLNVVKSGHVKRRDFEKVDLRILEAGFKMKAPVSDKKSVEVVNLMSGGVALVVLDKVNAPADLDEKALEDSELNIFRDYSAADFSSVLSSITSDADVYRNEKALQQ